MTKVCEGGCLCGAVRIRFEGEPVGVTDCYCSDCRKVSGTSHCTHIMLPETALTIIGELAAYTYTGDSGNTVTKQFCGTCGSPIQSSSSAMPGMVVVSASLLDDPDQVEPKMTIFADSAPKWARFAVGKPVFGKMPDG